MMMMMMMMMKLMMIFLQQVCPGFVETEFVQRQYDKERASAIFSSMEVPLRIHSSLSPSLYCLSLSVCLSLSLSVSLSDCLSLSLLQCTAHVSVSLI